MQPLQPFLILLDYLIFSSRLTAPTISRSGTVSCAAYNNKGYSMINTTIVVTGPGTTVRDVHVSI